MKLRQIASIPFGTFMQWYDFSLFGALAIVIAETFFPHASQYNKLMNTFLVFSVSFILAPLGALFFGHIGDTHGRKTALTISIFAMAIPTFIIAILPGYASLGITATSILILCRLLQGFSSSAEYAGSAVYLIENGHQHKKFFMGALTSVFYSLGSLTGALLATICTLALFPNWFWRIPFLLSAIGAFIAFYIRNKLPESCEFPGIQATRSPILQAFQHDQKAMITSFMLAATAGMLTYGLFVWLISYLSLVSSFSTSLSIAITMVIMATDALLEPIIAKIADNRHFSGEQISKSGLVLFAILIYPLLHYLSSSIVAAFICAFILGLLIAIICAPFNTLMALSYKPKHRCSGFGVSLNLGISLFGGTTPLVLTFLYGNNGTAGVAGYFIIACIIGFTALMLMTPSLAMPEEIV